MIVDEGRELVDTNVLVYAHDASAGAKGERARQLLDGLWESGRGCLSVQILQEFYVTATRKVKRILEPRAASEIVADLTSWIVHAPSAGDVVSAIELQLRHGVAFWDAMVLHSAAELGCRIVWSEDLNAGQTYHGVTVRNPFR